MSEQAPSDETTAFPVRWSIDDRGVARIVLDRPDVGNAYDGDMLRGLHRVMDELSAHSGLRAVMIRGAGRQFMAGADLRWLNAVREGDRAANLAASRLTASAVDRFNRLPVPTVALVHGFCVGGGTGLIAAADVVIAADEAQFSISEVRWGLTATIILPQLIDAIGARQARRYALTGERFDAAQARRIGLVHDVVPIGELAKAGERVVASLLANGPTALAATKTHIIANASGRVGGGRLATLIEAHADQRMSPEAAEGLASFREKRPGKW